MIDRNRRTGRRSGDYLLLGSASLDLLKQSSETLAGRIACLELTLFTAQFARNLGVDGKTAAGYKVAWSPGTATLGQRLSRLWNSI